MAARHPTRHAPGSKAYSVPRPVVRIVDRDGMNRAKLFEDTYRKRALGGLIIETFDRVAAMRS